jgi:putative methionine-R-sulfoxide reductase with GAF domain
MKKSKGETTNSRLAADLERRSWHNWLLIVCIVVLTTLGLGTAVVSFLTLKVGSTWPWPRTDLALLLGLSFVVLIFAAHLTRQQRYLMQVRDELERNREETSARIRKHYERLLAVYTVSQTLATQTNPQTVFDRMTRICFDTFSCEQVSLMLVDNQKKELVVRSAVGHVEGPLVIGQRQPIGEGVAGWVAENQEALLLGPDMDPKQFRDFKAKMVPLSWAMVVPIVVRDELVGVVNVSSRSAAISYDQEDLQALLVFAENAGICIRHTEQTDWMRQTNMRLEEELRKYEARTKAA